jgi:H/ACA ribonucleoprotein complex non-core subunit NAF1
MSQETLKILGDLLSEITLKIENQDSQLLNNNSSDSDSSSDSSDFLDSIKKKNQIRIKKFQNNSSDQDSNDDDEDKDPKKPNNNNNKYPKTKDEQTLDDLPPIEKLNLVLDKEIALVKVGRVISIVDNKLVVIQTLPVSELTRAKPLDEDTILFDVNRKGLGKIYETFGPVAGPFYSLRFNSNEIKDSQLEVQVDACIYYAPESAKYTQFIFMVDELRQAKGSDASWNNDNEPPAECIEYSDDEQEKLAKRQLKQKRIGKNKLATLNDSDESCEEETEGSKLTSPANMKKSTSFSNRGARTNTMPRSNNFMPKSHSQQTFSNNQIYPNYQQHQQQHIQQPQFGFNYGFNPSNQNQFHHQNQQNPNQMFMGGPYGGPYYPNNQMNPGMMGGHNPGYFMPPQPYYNQQQHQQQPYNYMTPQNQMYSQQQQQQHQPPIMPQQQQQQSQFNRSPVKNNQQTNSNIIDRRFMQNKNMIKKSF